MTSMPVRVLICDHRQVVRDALTRFLAQQLRIAEVMCASTADEAVRLARSRAVDVVVCNLGLRGEEGDGFDVLEALQYLDVDLPVVVITPADSPEVAARALLAGAAGCVDEQQPAAELMGVIAALGRRETVLDPRVAPQVLNAIRRSQQNRTNLAARLEQLTDREQEVIRLLALGYSRSAIAERLAISQHTVRTHIANAIAKLQVTNQVAAVTIMRQAAGLL